MPHLISLSRRAGGPLLGLETSGPHGSLALFDVSFPRPLVRRWPAQTRPSEQLVPTLQAALGDAGLPASALALIAVSHGPGSFTGIRVSMATAAGLAQGTPTSLRCVSSLAALACSTPASRVLTVLDARQGEIFAAVYENETDAARPIWPDRRIHAASLWDALGPHLHGQDYACVGDAAAAVAAQAPRPVPVPVPVLNVVPCACAILVQAASQEETSQPFVPNYMQACAAQARYSSK